MENKAQIITALRGEYDHWEDLLAGLSEEQITAPNLPSGLSIKDVIAHLHAWQQVSIARLEAARYNRNPNLPDWLKGLDPDIEENIDQYNDWIFQAHREQSWPFVYQMWREGFLRFIDLAEIIPENDLLEPGKFRWLNGYPLIAVLQGWYEHHHVDHLKPLLSRFHFEKGELE